MLDVAEGHGIPVSCRDVEVDPWSRGQREHTIHAVGDRWTPALRAGMAR